MTSTAGVNGGDAPVQFRQVQQLSNDADFIGLRFGLDLAQGQGVVHCPGAARTDSPLSGTTFVRAALRLADKSASACEPPLKPFIRCCNYVSIRSRIPVDM